MSIEVAFIILSWIGVIGGLVWLLQVLFSLLYYRKLNGLKRYGEQIQIDEVISVLIPYYNESDESIQKTLDSLLKQKGVKLEVVLVDDGNKNKARVKSEGFYDFKHIHLPYNMGKRWALYYGVKECSGKYLVVIDSDTTIKDNAIVELYRLIQEDGVGCVCGNIEVENERDNLLSLLISCMYWFAFHMERAAQSYFGSQTVCSGALSMYLREPYERFSDNLVNQKVFWTKNIAGDDRHMTNQFLLNGYSSVWARDAIAWTKTPSTVGKFIRQQLRWTRSFVMEIFWLFGSGNVFRLRLSSVYFIFKNFFKYFYALFLYIAGVIFVYTHTFLALLLGITYGVIIVGLVKGILSWAISKRFTMVLKTVGFGLFGYMVLTPFLLYGVFTFYKSGWLTRR